MHDHMHAFGFIFFCFIWFLIGLVGIVVGLLLFANNLNKQPNMA